MMSSEPTEPMGEVGRAGGSFAFEGSGGSAGPVPGEARRGLKAAMLGVALGALLLAAGRRGE